MIYQSLQDDLVNVNCLLLMGVNTALPPCDSYQYSAEYPKAYPKTGIGTAVSGRTSFSNIISLAQITGDVSARHDKVRAGCLLKSSYVPQICPCKYGNGVEQRFDGLPCVSHDATTRARLFSFLLLFREPEGNNRTSMAGMEIFSHHLSVMYSREIQPCTATSLPATTDVYPAP